MKNSQDLPLQRTMRIGNATVGLIGLDIALSRLLARSDLDEDAAVTELMRELAQQNYIPESALDTYQKALRREYRRLKQGREDAASHLSIRILGPGCVSCNRLNAMIFDILQEMGLAADIEQIHDLDEIWRHGVTRTPALIINGVLKSGGRMPRRAEVEEWLREAEHAAVSDR